MAMSFKVCLLISALRMRGQGLAPDCRGTRYVSLTGLELSDTGTAGVCHHDQHYMCFKR